MHGVTILGITERRVRQKEELRTSILQSAWQIVESEGWQALSIRKIADAVEYSVPVIYTHFENKEAILNEFARKGFSLLSEQLQQAKARSKKPDTQLRAIASAYWAFAFQHSEYYQLMFGLGIPACEEVNKVAELKKLSEVLLSSVSEVIKSGNNPESDVFLKFHTLWSILHGMVSIHMATGKAAQDEFKRAILNDAVDGFIKALTL